MPDAGPGGHRLSLLTGVALIGLCGCPATANQIEHENVAFDLSPDGRQIVFASADGDLFLFNIQTPGVVRLTSTIEVESTPAFSPDGTCVIYSVESDRGQGSSLAVHSLGGTGVRRLTADAGVHDAMPAYSADGTSIVFARAHRRRSYSMGGETWDHWDIYVMTPDGKNLRRITRQNYRGITAPRFQNSGRKIVFSADVNDSANAQISTLLEADANAAKPPHEFLGRSQQTGKGGTAGSQPDVSPDGESVVFVSDRLVPYQYDLFLKRRAEDLSPLRVTKISRYNQNPVFLPDGSGVLFLAATEWNASSRPIFSLWQVDLQGKGTRRIASSRLFTNPASWESQAN